MWCGSLRGLDPHHIKKQSQGGKDDLANCVSICRECHRKAEQGSKEKGVYLSPKGFQIKKLREMRERGQLKHGREAALEYLETLEAGKRLFDD